MLSSFTLWLWRLANTALLAVAVWMLWLVAARLDVLNGEIADLVDYVSVIAERLN
jgi:hypothetical protein